MQDRTNDRPFPLASISSVRLARCYLAPLFVITSNGVVSDDLSMNIKSIEQVDITEAARLFDLYRQFYKQPADAALALKFVTDRVRKRDSLILLAEDTPHLAGLLQVYPTFSSISASDVWLINDLYVDQQYRKRGIGNALVKHVQHLAKDIGIAQIRISTEMSNAAAQRLYASLGFAADDRFKHFVYRVS